MIAVFWQLVPSAVGLSYEFFFVLLTRISCRFIPESAVRRRDVLNAIGSLSLSVAVPGVAAAPAAFPVRERSIRWIVPFPPGGTSDLRTRQVAARLRADADWNVVVENRPGASGLIGTALVARSEADGHTLLLGTVGTLALNPNLMPVQPYVISRDLQPITQFSRSVSVLAAHRETGIRTLRDLERRVRSRGPLPFASTGNATIGHMVAEIYQRRAGIPLIHVPYKGTAPAVVDFAGGQVPLIVETPSALWDQIRGGFAVPLAVTSADRLRQMPSVPTFVEHGYRDMIFETWQGALTRRGVTDTVLDALHHRIVDALRHPEVVRSHEEQVNQVVANEPSAFEAHVAMETSRWARVIAETGIKLGGQGSRSGPRRQTAGLK